jgi:hypothetical protein
MDIKIALLHAHFTIICKCNKIDVWNGWRLFFKKKWMETIRRSRLHSTSCSLYCSSISMHHKLVDVTPSYHDLLMQARVP